MKPVRTELREVGRQEGGRAKAPRNPHYKHRDRAMMLHQRNRNNKRNQYQMALLRKESRSENISVQIDNVNQS